MSFVFTLVATLLRRTWKHLLRISLFVVFGTSALIYLASLGAAMRGLLQDGAREILGADLIVGFSIPPTREDLGWIKSLGFGETREQISASMVTSPVSKSILRVRFHQITGPFPLYFRGGEAQDKAAWGALREPGVIVVEKRFLLLAGVKVGDVLESGDQRWKIGATVDFVPGEISAIGRLDPDVYVAGTPGAAGGAGPAAFSIRNTHRLWFKAADPDGRRELTRQLNAYFPDGSISLETPERLQGRMEKYIGRLESFLRFSSHSVLLLGLVGLAFAHGLGLRADWDGARALVAIGATPVQVLTIHFILGVAALGAGILEGSGLVWLIGPHLDEMWRQVFALPAGAILQRSQILSTQAVEFPLGALCLFVSIFSFLRPLGAAPTTAGNKPPTNFAWKYGIGLGAMLLAAVALLLFRADRQQPLALLAAAGVGAGLIGAILGLLKLAGGFGRRSPFFTVQYAVARVRHDRWRTVLITSTLAIAVAVSLAIRTASTLLFQQWGDVDNQDVPTVALLNVASTDLEFGQKALQDAGGNVDTLPLVAADLISILPDTSKDRGELSPVEKRRLEKRTYTVTHRGQLGRSEQVTAGSFPASREPGDAVVPISITEKLAADGVKLGDRLLWNVGDVQILTRVASIRRVDFDRFYSSVAVLFPEGVIDGAPTTYALTARGRDEEAVITAIKQVTKARPHIIGFDLTSDVATMRDLFGKMRALVLPAAILAWLLAAIIAAGILATLKLQRRREHETMGAMGASPADITLIVVTEGGIITAMATVVGALPALWGCQWVCVHVLEIPGRIAIGQVLGSWAGIWLLLILAIGVAAAVATNWRTTRASAEPGILS